MSWKVIEISAKQAAKVKRHKKAHPAPEGWCYVDDEQPPLYEVVLVRLNNTDGEERELVAHWETISGIAMAQVDIATRQELSWCYPDKVWPRSEPMYGKVSLLDLWQPIAPQQPEEGAKWTKKA